MENWPLSMESFDIHNTELDNGQRERRSQMGGYRKEGREKLNYGTDPTQSWLLQELFLEWAFSFLLSWVTITTALG